MKIKFIGLASVLLVAGVWAAEQLPGFRATSSTPTPAVSPVQSPGLWTENWITTNSFSASGYPFIQSGPISCKYVYSAGQPAGVRSAYLVDQDLNAARVNYLAWRREQAEAALLKAALLLQEDMNLAKPRIQTELRGCALALEQEAKRIADGHTDPVSRMDAIIRAARQAAMDYDYSQHSGAI